MALVVVVVLYLTAATCVSLFPSLPPSPTSPQVPPFFPSLVIRLGAGMGTARGEVPTRLKLPACLSPFSLFFLLEVEHHWRAVRFSAINCNPIRKRQSAHTCPRDLEKCAPTRIRQIYIETQHTEALMCANASKQNVCYCVCVCEREQLTWTFEMCVYLRECFCVYLLPPNYNVVNENDTGTW